MQTINIYIFTVLNGLAGHYPWLDWVAIFVTNYLSYGVSIVCGLYVCLWLPMKQDKLSLWVSSFRQARELLVSVCVTWVVIYGTKVMTAIPRPFHVLYDMQILLPFQRGYSFPSGHTAITCAIATVVYFYHKRLGVGLYVFAGIIALSRIYVGVHYPIDVVVGAALGVVVPLCIHHWMFKSKLSHWG